MYDSRLGKWWSVDPAQSDYPGISDYSFAMNNPIIFIDPDGKKVYPTNDEALEIIKLGLSPEESQFVTLDKNNYIDLNTLQKGKNQLGSIGENYESLLQLVEAKEVVEVTVSETMVYKNADGQIMEDKYSNTRTIDKSIDDLWFTQGGSQDFSGKVMGLTYKEYLVYMEGLGESNEPVTLGKVGETLYPKSMEEAPSGHYSTNENIQVHVTNKSHEVDVVTTQAHESYGHALFKILGKKSGHGKSRMIGVEGTNEELEIKINKAEKEAADNYGKHKNP